MRQVEGGGLRIGSAAAESGCLLPPAQAPPAATFLVEAAFGIESSGPSWIFTGEEGAQERGHLCRCASRRPRVARPTDRVLYFLSLSIFQQPDYLVCRITSLINQFYSGIFHETNETTREENPLATADGAHALAHSQGPQPSGHGQDPRHILPNVWRIERGRNKADPRFRDTR